MRCELIRCGVALAALLAAPAQAQDRPVFPPTRDVAVSYQSSLPEPNAPQNLTMRYSAASDRVRIEGSLQGGKLPGYVLFDHKSHHTTIVIEQLGLMMEAPRRGGLDQALVLENARHFDRLGRDTVAGLDCTVWAVDGESASGTACVTADGVVLRAGGQDRKGRTASIEATRVDYGRQAPALFFPPATVHRLDLAAGPGGSGAAALLDRLRHGQP